MATRAATAAFLLLATCGLVLLGPANAFGQICTASVCGPPEVTATSVARPGSATTTTTAGAFATTTTTAGEFTVGRPIQGPTTTPEAPETPDVAAPPRAPGGLPITGGDAFGLLLIGLTAIALGGAVLRTSRD